MAAKKRKTSKSTTKKASQDTKAEVESILELARVLARKPRRARPHEAIFDAWNIVLGRTSKGARLVRLLKDLAKDNRWEFGEDDNVTHLQPGSWNHAVRNIVAPAYEAAAFAEVQYARLRLVFKPPLRFGTVKVSNAAVGTKKEIAKQQSDKAKQAALAKKNPDKSFARAADVIQKDWTARRESAGQIHKLLQKAVSALCTKEYERLETRVARQVSDETRKRCQEHLREMKSRRRSLSKASADDPQTSERLPNHLRKWLGARNKIVRTIDFA